MHGRREQTYRVAVIDEDGIRRRWKRVGSKLDERGRRLWAAGEVQPAGYSALAAVSRITGIALDDQSRRGRSRRVSAAGRSRAAQMRRRQAVEPLRWVSRSRAKLAQALEDMGHAISANTVGKLLVMKLGFSRQTNRKAIVP